ARLLSSVDARPVHPAAHSVGRDPSQVMQVPQRRPHRLARHLLPPLVEHPDEPVLRLLVVLGPHASFSPFAWKESLHQTQCGSLVELLSSLYAPDGTVAVAGFYDDVVPLTDEERAMIARTDLSEAQLLEATGAPAAWGDERFTVRERVSARPTLDINGLWSGYSGPGPKTIIPASAGAKLSSRLVADQDPQRVFELLEAHLQERAPDTVEVEVRLLTTGRPALVPFD